MEVISAQIGYDEGRKEWGATYSSRVVYCSSHDDCVSPKLTENVINTSL
jgi:hypothetical protein